MMILPIERGESGQRQTDDRTAAYHSLWQTLHARTTRETIIATENKKNKAATVCQLGRRNHMSRRRCLVSLSRSGHMHIETKLSDTKASSQSEKH